MVVLTKESGDSADMMEPCEDAPREEMSQCDVNSIAHFRLHLSSLIILRIV